MTGCGMLRLLVEMAVLVLVRVMPAARRRDGAMMTGICDVVVVVVVVVEVVVSGGSVLIVMGEEAPEPLPEPEW